MISQHTPGPWYQPATLKMLRDKKEQEDRIFLYDAAPALLQAVLGLLDNPNCHYARSAALAAVRRATGESE